MIEPGAKRWFNTRYYWSKF